VNTTGAQRRSSDARHGFQVQAGGARGGKVELSVPLPKGTRVAVFVMEESEDDFSDLVLAAQSSLNFWNNPIDDEVWNNA